jgi:hypothetical protein
MPTKVIVFIEKGIVSHVLTDSEIQLVVIDTDTEGLDDDQIMRHSDIDKSHYRYVHNPVEVDKNLCDSVFKPAPRKENAANEMSADEFYDRNFKPPGSVMTTHQGDEE